MNGYEKHGIAHTSPSQINMWDESPAAWVARYLYNAKFSFGVAAQVGVLTESVVSDVLMGSTLSLALEKAHKTFKKNNALNTNENDLNRIHDIEPMAILALEQLEQYGEPEFIQTINGIEQQRISLKCNGWGWELPVIGYLDFVYPKHGLIVDLKTTLRCPSVMSASHARQAAIYGAAKPDMEVKFLYVTPKKHNWLWVDDKNHILKEVKNILNRQERMLKYLDKEQLKECAPLALSSYFWNGSENILKELYSH